MAADHLAQDAEADGKATIPLYPEERVSQPAADHEILAVAFDDEQAEA